MTTPNGHSDSQAGRKTYAAGLEEALSSADEADREMLRSVWMQVEDLDNLDAVDESRKIATRDAILAAARESQPKPHVFRLPSLRLVQLRPVVVAASILALVGISFTFAPEVHVISAPLGSVSAVHYTLPDGSEGYLSAGSELRYSDSFGDGTRLVALKGEAVFDVVKDESPFVVQTYDTRVAALGTSFSVRSWNGDIESETVVSVREGRVAVAARYADEHNVELQKDEQLRAGSLLSAGDAIVTQNTVHTFNWIGGGIDFVNMPIGNVLSELSRRYDIVLSAPSSIRDRRITLLPSEMATVEDILVDMSAAVNIRYRKIAGGYEFFLN